MRKTIDYPEERDAAVQEREERWKTDEAIRELLSQIDDLNSQLEAAKAPDYIDLVKCLESIKARPGMWLTRADVPSLMDWMHGWETATIQYIMRDEAKASGNQVLQLSRFKQLDEAIDCLILFIRSKPEWCDKCGGKGRWLDPCCPPIGPCPDCRGTWRRD